MKKAILIVLWFFNIMFLGGAMESIDEVGCYPMIISFISLLLLSVLLIYNSHNKEDKYVWNIKKNK